LGVAKQTKLNKELEDLTRSNDLDDIGKSDFSELFNNF
jgi:hypothetical protein